MRFGWQGFSFEHPDDWAPLVLSGNRKEGYARLVSANRRFLQIRWRQLSQPADANKFLDGYLGKLQQDAKKADIPFRSERQPEHGHMGYRYTGPTNGRGYLFQPFNDKRAFVLEVASNRNDSLVGILNQSMDSFIVHSDRERWSVHGLDLSLPPNLAIERHEFLAGKTKLALKGAGIRIEAERWGFADQLITKHGLLPWATAILQTNRSYVNEEAQGLRVMIPGGVLSAPSETIVAHQPDRNQLVFVKVATRDPRRRPQWDWLN